MPSHAAHAIPRLVGKFNVEAFIVCTNYSPPAGYTPTMANPMMGVAYSDDNAHVGINRKLAPFVACGDLSGWDSDMTYSVAKGAVVLDPVQKPINAPYQHFFANKK